jgi:hypothetical protein
MNVRKHIRKIVSTVLIAAMLFFVPTVIPSIIPAKAVPVPCGVIITPWLQLPNDTAFAAVPIPCPPAPLPPAHVPAWVWAGIACPASIILSGVVANFRDNRQLTTAEAWTCGLLYWWSWFNPPPQKAHH